MDVAVYAEIFVSGGDVGVPRLITRYHYTFGIGKITDAGVLHAVELIFTPPFQRFAHCSPTLVEDIRSHLPDIGTESTAKQVAIPGV